MLPLHYNDSVWYVNRPSGYGSVPHGFPVPRIELGSWPWKGHILPLDYTGGCSFERYIIGLFRSTVLRVMSPTRFLCATMIGGVIGWFRSTSSGLVSMHPLHYNGWFRPTSSNTASMRPHTATTCFDKCPSVAHICHSLHCVPINHINDFLPCGNLLSLIQLIA